MPGPAASAQTANELTISRVNQTAFLTWFAEDGVAYQLESSVDLESWSSLGPVNIGAGSFISFPYSIAGQSRGFFRLNRLQAFASFNPGTGELTVTGNDLDNIIVVSRDAAGNIVINDGTILISGGVPTAANTTHIHILGKDGDDRISLDESNGAMPGATISGDEGNDTLIGGSGADLLFGGSGNDTLLGKGGADSLFGGAGDDTLTGGDGDDQVFGEADNDRMVWNPGDDTDLNEGGGGTDTIEINGGNGAEVFTTTANGTRVRFDRIDPAPFTLDIGTSEFLVLNANGGNDTFSATGNLAALIQITVDGGPGEDTLLGSNGADVLMGGDDNDFIDGNQGNDTLVSGNGDDVFQWDPGDGSDVMDGQAGNDRLVFNGSNIGEIFDVSANGSRIRFTRNIANIVLDFGGIETLDLNALGGPDSLIVNDLTGTELTRVNGNLASTVGGGTGDGQADVVTINGTAADDIVSVTLSGGELLVTGLAVSVAARVFEGGLDTIRVQGLGGDDIIDASAVGIAGPLFVLDGGTGNDILLGSAGSDTLLGGDNDDVLLGNVGIDALDGGLGDNTLIQDGNNVIFGIVSLFGDALDNSFTISRDAVGALYSNGIAIPGATVANTSLIRVFGRSGNDTIAIDETNGAMPAAMFFGGAGNDTLVGGSGLDLLFGGPGNDALFGKAGADLIFGGSGDDSLTGGDGDDQVFGESDSDRLVWSPGDDTDLDEGGSGSDTVEVNGGDDAEVFTTTANGTRVRFDRIDPAPFALDIGTSELLVLNASGGNDKFSATGNLAVLIQIAVDGGSGEDTLLGSNGADTLMGGDDNDFIDGNQGNDALVGGNGDDVFQWDPGDGSDVMAGQAGNDRLVFNGSNIGEIFDVSASGGHITFTRNIASILLDLNGIETLDLNAVGGPDSLTVHDLAGTDLTRVNANLASTFGGSTGDGQADAITINGTAFPDALSLTVNAGAVEVTGLTALIRILTSEVLNDKVIINGLEGVDSFNLAPGVTSLIGVTTNQ